MFDFQKFMSDKVTFEQVIKDDVGAINPTHFQNREVAKKYEEETHNLYRKETLLKLEGFVNILLANKVNMEENVDFLTTIYLKECEKIRACKYKDIDPIFEQAMKNVILAFKIKD